jgi:hypothetical protein
MAPSGRLGVEEEAVEGDGETPNVIDGVGARGCGGCR